jgi:transposase
METEALHFIGIDWGNEHHEVCVLDAHGKVPWRRKFAHTGEGVQALVEALRSVERPIVAIETPRGALVETLIAQGLRVFHINPKQADRFRDRHTAAGAKDDRLDAFSLADAIRTDRPCFREVTLPVDELLELHDATRLQRTFEEDKVRTQNRVREHLLRTQPALLALCEGVDEPWFWDLLEKAPDPAAARKLTAAQVGAILKRRRIRRVTPAQVLAALRDQGLRVTAGSAAGASAAIRLQVPQIRLLHEQLGHIEKRIRALLDGLPEDDTEGQKREHRDVDILRSLPGVGEKTAAAMLAEVPQLLAERNYRALRAHTGVAPVTDATGKRSKKHATIRMRRACNVRLRTVVHLWAGNAMLNDPAWRAYYTALKQRGMSHGAACRCVGDRLLRVLCACLRADRRYDPAVFAAQARKAA